MTDKIESDSSTIQNGSAPKDSGCGDIRRGDRVPVYDSNQKKHFAGAVQNLHRDDFIKVNFDDGFKHRTNLLQEDWSYQYESDIDTSVNPSSSAIRNDPGQLSISFYEPIGAERIGWSF